MGSGGRRVSPFFLFNEFLSGIRDGEEIIKSEKKKKKEESHKH